MNRQTWALLAGVALMATVLILVGCATVVKPTVSVCPPVKLYTLQQQRALADALAALPSDNPLAQAMVDYGQLRAAARACGDPKPS